MSQFREKLFDVVLVLVLIVIAFGLTGVAAKMCATAFRAIAVLTEAVEMDINRKCNCEKDGK